MTTTKTLTARIGTKVAHNVTAAAVLLAVLMGGQMVGNDDPTPAERPAPSTSPTGLVEAYDCWTGQAPADMEGKVPGHVVVTQDNVARYAGPRVVAQALAQVFDGEDHGLTIHAFCR